MATLYELTEEYRQLLEMMEDDTVDPEVLQDTLEGVDGEIEAKADNCAKLIRELNGVTSVINEEIERLKARKDVISNNADRVKKYLEKAMIDTGKRKFKTALFGFNIQKNPASVVVDQEDKIPEEYVDVNTIITAGSLLTAVVVIFSAVFAVYKWYLRQNEQDKEIERMKSEQCLLTYGILACLKGLKEQGCNGPVTEAIDKIQKHINKQAHDQED